MSQRSRDTIFALSSGVGKAAVAVVRVSGPRCPDILQRICRRAEVKEREATLTWMYDAAGNVLDRGLVVQFSAPRSFTGEPMLELHVTGGRAIVAGLIKALFACAGTRLALAGEFAMRAFNNGKLDLTQVEGLASLVDAETSAQLRHAVSLASGALRRECERIRALLLDAMAEAEAMLDFSDVDDADRLSQRRLHALVDEAATAMEGLLRNSTVAERLRDGLVVVIAGAPNVGKSTLLNYLAQRDVALVSPVPGTTRDSLEVFAEIGGYPVTFIDTAGIRETADPLEAQGIARSLQKAGDADLVLWLAEDGSGSPAPSHGAAAVFEVRGKADLRPSCPSSMGAINISGKTGEGVDLLIGKIAAFAEEHFAGADSLTVATERQRDAAREALRSLAEARSVPALSLEVTAELLRAASASLGRIVGRIGVEEVFDEIFSRLCVGK